MKPYLFALLMLIAGTKVWGDCCLYPHNESYPKVESGFQVVHTTIDYLPLTSLSHPLIWTVIKGTQSYSLDEFISSGKFCEIYGHKWISFRAWEFYPCKDDSPYACAICNRCRRKITVKKDVEEWEP